MSTPTRITKLLAYLDSELAACFPTHLELQDPDDLFENLDTELAAGWGVVVEGSRNTERCLDGQNFYLQRDLTIVLTRDLASQGSDRKLRKAKRDQLLEDVVLLYKRLTGQFSIEVDGVTLAFAFSFAGDSGVREISVRDGRYIFTEITVSAEYREPKT